MGIKFTCVPKTTLLGVVALAKTKHSMGVESVENQMSGKHFYRVYVIFCIQVSFNSCFDIFVQLY